MIEDKWAALRLPAEFQAAELKENFDSRKNTAPPNATPIMIRVTSIVVSIAVTL